MKKIISLFQRNYDGDRLVRDELTPGAEWVLSGEGIATRKFDGTCCLVRGGKLFKRYEIKPGGKAPQGFEPANDMDEVTGKQQGWVPVGDGPEDCWHREAWDLAHREVSGGKLFLLDGTYELLGPKVQGNPEAQWLAITGIPTGKHWLKPHGSYAYLDGTVPRTFSAIRDWLFTHDVEGVVWWRVPLTVNRSLPWYFDHQDCDKVKIKGKDFGIERVKCKKS